MMAKKQPSANTEHLHRFRYDSPNGPVSVGRCKCGAEKAGYNSYAMDRDPQWNRDAMTLVNREHSETRHAPRRTGEGVDGVTSMRTPATVYAARPCDLCGRTITALGMASHRKACERKRGVA